MGGELRVRGSENKTPFVVAVSVDENGHPIAMNLNVVKGFISKEIERWAKAYIESGSVVYSDGLNCFPAVKNAGCKYTSYVTGGGVEGVEKPGFILVNTMIGNVKNALIGSYHAINHKHLPRYIAEFCYRFNRRFNLRDIIPRFCL